MTRPLGSRYVLHELLGSGAMGQVFQGTARTDAQPVAVKVLRPELISDPEVLARFLQERSILTSISHRHVVRVLDLVVEGETAGIVMELVPGQDLRHLLSARRTLPPAQAVHFARQLLDGAAAVHDAGIIHRDIKPENVLVDGSADEVILKLTDFGIARLTYGPVLTKQPGLLGTPEYMAPEVADSAPGTPAADLYSIGIVLYEMLAGRTPFKGGHLMAVLSRHVEQLPIPIPGVTDELWALVEWLLAKDPHSRPRSAAEAAAAASRLEPALAGEPALAPLPPLSEMPAPLITALPARPSMSMSTVGLSASPHPAPAARYPQVADPAETGHPATVLSPPAPRHLDKFAPTGDQASYAPPPAPGWSGPAWSGPAWSAPGWSAPGWSAPGWSAPDGSAARPAEARRPRVDRRLAIGGAAVAAVVLVVLAFVVAAWASHPSAAPAADGSVSYTFAPDEYQDGLLIVRRWTLAGKDGSMLTETVSASSATGHAQRVQFQDDIPKAVASTTQTVAFTPAPAKIVKADPVVDWLLQLPSHGTVQVGYTATVPARGATNARLMGLVKDFDVLQAADPAADRPHAVQVVSLAVEPGSVQVQPNGTMQLALTGLLSNGQAAPQAVLGSAAWSSANPAVASVSLLGTVTGIGAGSTDVTAQIGSAQASVPVTVVAAGSAKSASTKTAQKITFTSTLPATLTVGSTYDVTATGGGSGNLVTFTIGSASASVCSVTGSTVTFNKPGICDIDANQAGNAGYLAAAQVQQAVGMQVISFSAAPGTVGQVVTLTATGGGPGNPVAFTVDSASGAGVCSVSGSTVTYLAAGDCVIDANETGGDGYQAAAQVQQIVQLLSFPVLPAASVGGSATLTATGGGSGNPVSFTVDSASGAGVCSVSGSTVTYLAAGTCVIDANQAGTGDYVAAGELEQSFAVSAAPAP